MTLNPHKNASRFGVVLLLVTLAAAAATANPAEAQLTVYRVEGVVYSPHYQPLPGATLVLHTMAGARAGTATTDASGKYAITNLQSGKYNLSVSDECCRATWIPIEIAGTDPVIQQNVVMSSDAGQGPLQLSGIVKDEKTGKGMANVRIELYNFVHSEQRMYKGEDHQNTISAADGSYSFRVDAGSISINVRHDGYDTLHANFEISASRTLDLPMRAASGAVATIQGTLKGSDGKVIPNAYVYVQPDHQCDGEVCTASPHGSTRSGPSGQDNIWYEPAQQPYAGTQTDANGKYRLQTLPGRILLQAHAEGYLENHSRFTANDGENKTLNLVLERMPADSVRVSGVVTDAQTGRPIPFADVHLENQRWGHWNGTMTDKDGRFVLHTKPGYTIITARAEKFYWLPCTADSERGIAPSEPYPCSGGGQQERERDYYSRVLALPSDKTSHDVKLELQPRPAPTAVLVGYVVNATSQSGIPDVQVQFYNEFTRDWGVASTDKDGSYRIKVHPGYYTIRASAQHYFDGVVQATVADGETKRVDLFLEPGEKRYGFGGCCYTMAAGRAEHDMASSAPKMGGAGTSTQESSLAAGDRGSGQEAYKGEGGGLGPYKPFTGGDSSGGNAPGLGVLALLATLGLAVVVRRRSH